MNRLLTALVLALNAALPTVAAGAGNLSCAQDGKTFMLMCFSKNAVRQNGEVRATKLYKGGPKSVEATPYTARVHCGNGVLELTDSSGVAFARNVPEAQVGKDFVQYLCAHSPTKRDPKLSTK